MTVAELHSKPYAAPEREDDAADARSDLYSLGVTVIDLLGGLDTRLPKDADPRKALEQLDVPDDARHFLGSLIDPDPDNRPFSAKIALTELDRFLVWQPEAPPAQTPAADGRAHARGGEAGPRPARSAIRRARPAAAHR